MYKLILSSLYFFLPAYFTNMAPPLAKRFGIFDFLDKPIDFDKTFNNKRILGAHKTWRGAVAGISIGILMSCVQAWLYQYPFTKQISLINYQNINVLFFGFLMSFGTVLGDLFFAFIKRRLNLKPGTKFIPFDQINYVIGVYVIFSLTDAFKIDNLVWIVILISTFFLHIIVNRLGYLLGLHKAKW
ncbi:MAG: CDP-archaeol synthase [Patescibacteria group bacterium]|nr:CDP-archaeol synthase [Patescibacteria group bacterium]